jgi:hypothetical protein
MQIRDRIREFRRVPASALQQHPRNWRVHPAEQQAALQGVLREIGYANALLARELSDGSLELIDGHLRAATTPDQLVPVLVLDVTAAEADKILLTHDPLAGLAETNAEQLNALLAEYSFESPAVQHMLAQLTTNEASSHAAPQVQVPELFQVLVHCVNESEQREVYEQLVQAGRDCRVLSL